MKFLGVGFAAMLLAACGGSNGAGPDGAAGGSGGSSSGSCHANSPLGATVSWKEDGVAKCAVSVVAQRGSDNVGESLQLQGANLDGASVGFAVIAYAATLEGSHDCSTTEVDGGPIGTPGTFYVVFVHPGTKQTCNVSIENAGVPGGVHAKGSFSATFVGTGGAVVTSGVFDTPVTAPPGGTKK